MSDLTPAREALYHRVVDAVSMHDVTPDEKDRIMEGTGDAASWERVPLGVQALITEVEKRPLEAWNDPADLPDQKGI